jgi:hypothetical protein
MASHDFFIICSPALVLREFSASEGFAYFHVEYGVDGGHLHLIGVVWSLLLASTDAIPMAEKCQLWPSCADRLGQGAQCIVSISCLKSLHFMANYGHQILVSNQNILGHGWHLWGGIQKSWLRTTLIGTPIFRQPGKS